VHLKAVKPIRSVFVYSLDIPRTQDPFYNSYMNPQKHSRYYPASDRPSAENGSGKSRSLGRIRCRPPLGY
jgi:hypothetical protein